MDIDRLVPKIIERIKDAPDYALMDLDPIYKVLGQRRDENKAGDVAELLNEKDAMLGVVRLTDLASIYALTGEKDLALQQLEIVSKLPVGPPMARYVLIPYGTRCATIRASRRSSPPSRRKTDKA
jgi:hypothetical protein